MSFRSRVSFVSAIVGLVACSATPVKSTLTGKPTAAQLAELWVQPERGRDLFNGVGGSRLAPDPSAVYTVIDMKRVTAGDDPAKRADLGIGRGDVVVKGSAITAKVHSLGAQDTQAAKLELVDASGQVLNIAAIPALKAPRDLLPKTASVKLKIPAGVKAQGLRVRIVSAQPQNTALNDEVVLP